ncbi:MAG TPA: radical SAM protein, partial [Clostridia bacterium]|nr:radical SAM protein [Clostridia bacterium]
MPSIAVCTLGCKVNQYDTQAMLELFQQAGYEAVAFDEAADVYLVNTCTVTGTGDQKSRQMIRRAHRRNPFAGIIVAGCMAQRAAETLLLPGVRLILGTQNRKDVVRLLDKAMAQAEPLIAVKALREADFETLSIRASEGRTRAALKIQEGCDQHCTYCIIPSVRGPVRSRPLQDVREEAARLAEHGFQETVLTGIHLSSYGRDLGNVGLPDALEALERTAGIARVRLGSLEPNLITPEFVQKLHGYE